MSTDDCGTWPGVIGNIESSTVGVSKIGTSAGAVGLENTSSPPMVRSITSGYLLMGHGDTNVYVMLASGSGLTTFGRIGEGLQIFAAKSSLAGVSLLVEVTGCGMEKTNFSGLGGWLATGVAAANSVASGTSTV